MTKNSSEKKKKRKVKRFNGTVDLFIVIAWTVLVSHTRGKSEGDQADVSRAKGRIFVASHQKRSTRY